MAAKKAVAKKAVAKKSTAKKTSGKRGSVKVKMIQTVDSAPGRDTTVFFTDGTRAVVKKGNELSDMLTKPESVAPNLIQVTMSGKNIVAAEPVEVDKPSA